MSQTESVAVPDIGDFDEVDVIEILVSPGDRVEVDAPLVTLESDKASMEVPSPMAGVVQEVKVSLGDKVGEGHVLVVLEVSETTETSEQPADSGGEEPVESGARDASTESSPGAEAAEPEPPEPEPPEPEPPETQPSQLPAPPVADSDHRPRPVPHASPSVRRFARELGVDVHEVEGTGNKGRILKEDVQSFVKRRLSGLQPVAAPESSGAAGIPPVPAQDYSKFGDVEEVALSRIRRAAARNLHRSWLNVPHVTQFDEADITDLEAFRKERKEEAAAQGVKLTPLAFFMKATVRALQEYPEVNSSLSADGEKLIVKKYFHLGIAVDTPDGLVVPVIRDVDRKGVYDLARELDEISQRAREGKLGMGEMQGASFSISSLGGIGGTAFTPIVNAPEVAILGIARAQMKPVWRSGEFVPRLVVPLALSYDHRVIDGAAGVRFTTFLSGVLSDLRTILL